MQNDMRDRLVDLIAIYDEQYDCDTCMNVNKGGGCGNKCLADYLIANGVIVPPCKAWQTVYCIVFKPVGCKFSVEKGFVREIYITKDNARVNIVDCELTRYANLNITVYLEDFGKTVFLTKEQAEQKLKEMRVENG